MYIIKHRTRRATRRMHEDRRSDITHYYSVNGELRTDDVEMAIDIAFDAYKELVASSTPAPTIWEVYERTA